MKTSGNTHSAIQNPNHTRKTSSFWKSFRVKRSFLPLILLLPLQTYAQVLTQVVRGQVTDIESQAPLPFATVAIVNGEPPMGTISDENGHFRFDAVPVGRHNVQVSYMGYETTVIPELMVTSSKELVLEVRLKESVSKIEEVVVKAHTKKDKPLNSMATVSARTFSVEEARRYAGGMDDPGRLVSAFAGVSTECSRDNTIVIRGNSPKGLLWRLEGVEIPNPSHFADMATFGGGGVSAISSLVMGNSDFYTGAFPAEYGNATSGVFDIRLRKGNNQRHEHAVQLGAMGLDLSSEGPLGKRSRSSYLFNYRYSTMGLIKVAFPPEIKDFIPVYQDLSFKINMPTGRAGNFSLWGLGSDNHMNQAAEEDSTLWEMAEDRYSGDVNQQVAALGISHTYAFRNTGYLNTSLAWTGKNILMETQVLDDRLEYHDNDLVDGLNYKYTLTSLYNRKFSARHTNRSGFIIDHLHYNTLLKFAPGIGTEMVTLTDEQGTANMYQLFSQSKFTLHEKFLVNAGVHGHYFDLNGEWIAEPRLGLTWSFVPTQSVSLAYGKHSRTEPLSLYFAGVNQGSGPEYPNKEMALMKAHHLVASWDVSFTSTLRLKVEPYLQLLYDVPVIPDSSFSTLNFEADWFFNEELVNSGTGRNIGLDLTLERFLKDGYYFLATASVFDSKYTGDDGVERNTRFNSRYVFNVLGGKEWTLGARKNKILGVNFRLNFTGGKRETPVDITRSEMTGEIVYDYSQLYEGTERGITYASATINYRINKERHSGIWSIQMMNLFMSKENYGYYYNYRTGKVDKFEFAVPVPNISYRIEF